MLSWIATAGTLACIYLAGRKNVLAWPIGLVAQVFWLGFSWQVGDAGLLAINAIVPVLYAFNWWNWRKK